MKIQTKSTRKKIIIWSLPVILLAAIAFILLPSLLPANFDKMKRSVTLIECREYYEITQGNKVIAVCNDIESDTTLNIVKEEVHSHPECQAMA